MPIALDYKSDHLVVRIVGRGIITALRRSVVVPYSSIARVEAESPRWPVLTDGYYLGTLVPDRVAHGTFWTWDRSRRRFLFFETGDASVLSLHLSGHPDFDEVSVQCVDPAAARDELAKRASR